MQVAWSGQADEASFKAGVASIFKLDVDSYEDVFGGAKGVKNGLHVLRAQLAIGRKKRHLERTRYAVTLLHLKTKPQRDLMAQDVIHDSIARAHEQLVHLYVAHIDVANRLGHLSKLTQ